MHVSGLPLLRESRVKLAEYARQRHHVVPEEGTKFEDILKEEYWAAVAYMFKPCDIIEVHAEEGSYYAELYVRASGRNWAKVAVLNKTALEPIEAQVTRPEFEVLWKGPARRFSAIRVSDGEILKDGFETREQAVDYIKDHTRAVAA